jgi:hypothetical protein
MFILRLLPLFSQERTRTNGEEHRQTKRDVWIDNEPSTARMSSCYGSRSNPFTFARRLTDWGRSTRLQMDIVDGASPVCGKRTKLKALTHLLVPRRLGLACAIQGDRPDVQLRKLISGKDDVLLGIA